jgi:DNA-binding CsgD family transcriptional regulator/tetratricopeptide (TPR) repeat protein
VTGVQAAIGHVVCPTLVGRARELDALAALAAASAAGRCEAVLVAGEAGVGKTRLLEEARERVTGARALTGGCLEQQRSLPYAPLAEALRAAPEALEDPVLRRLLPELDAGAPERDSDHERHRIAQALAAFLARAAAERPLVLTLEDLHWADGATIDLLGVLVRRLASEPVLLLVSYRSDELHERPDVSAAVADLTRRRVAHELRLAPLDLEQVEEMIHATLSLPGPIRADFVEAVHARTDGNPLHVEELLRTLRETGDAVPQDRRAIADLEVPASIQDTILRRVARVDDRARELLRVGAVVGQRFELEPARRVAGLDEEEALGALRALVHQHLVVEEPESGELRFRHALTRDTVYGQLLVAERRRLHRQVAEVLEELHGASAAAELVLHYEAAGDDERARELALRAGRRAASLGAIADARAQYATALRLGGAPELLRAMGLLSYAAGDLPTSIAELEKAAEEAHARGDLRAQARARLDLAGSLLMNGDRAGSLRERQSALFLLEPEGDSEELAAAYRGLGTYHMLGSAFTEATAWSERAIALAQLTGAERVELEARNDLGVSVGLGGDPARGLELLRDCVRTGTGRGWTREASRAYVNLSDSLTQLGRLEEARAVAAEGAAFCERAGSVFYARLCGFHVAECARLTGDWEEAERRHAELRAAAEEQGSRKYRLMLLEGLGALRADQGRWREVQQLREELRPLAFERDELQHVTPFLMISARAEAAAGRAESALAELERLRDYARATDDTTLIAPGLALGCELGAPWLEDLERAAHASPSPETAVWLDEASGRFGQAAARWGELGRPYDRARALRRSGTTEALHEARELAARLGAEHERTLAEAALRRAGVRVPRGPRSSTRAAPGGLTARELEVARLIADGATNAELAHALVIAPKTAAAHVSHILDKLGFSSRAQIARWVAEQAVEN